ncbi:helix-turn-helix transcriptional regulator [Christensenellaceae bacterium NSJ-63]|uniref:Helix-turn-helix transcriptional regulator n=1 Tax=Guopingia tenuis TaxID=2763656 RepID=A0A926HUZ1_9FIRM|nr:helix-turn-helix transcriptional regulator [Guopingia tenuis]MBC8537424.1 helix-turn-helix transcriptional regulator [Guopingia tenuis]
MKISIRKIEAIMARNGFTKSVLSERSGISRQNISTITLRGTCEPKTAGRIAQALGVDVTEIMDEG